LFLWFCNVLSIYWFLFNQHLLGFKLTFSPTKFIPILSMLLICCINNVGIVINRVYCLYNICEGSLRKPILFENQGNANWPFENTFRCTKASPFTLSTIKRGATLGNPSKIYKMPSYWIYALPVIFLPSYIEPSLPLIVTFNS
jgi:hypothetical protein